MIALLRAEWKKIAGNRLTVIFLIWIWPIIACVGVGLYTLILLISGNARENFDPIRWTEIALFPWLALNNPLGRLLLVGFTASVFAGEYQYQTWKLVLPGNRRIELLAAKYAATVLYIAVAFSLTMIILVTAVGLMHVVVGETYGPALTQDTAADLLSDLIPTILAALTSIFIVTTVAALVALRTRTILFGVLAGMLVTFGDWIGIPSLLSIGANVLELKWLPDLVILTPSFNIDNLRYWIMAGEPLNYLNLDTQTPWAASIAVLAVWAVVLLGLSMIVFQRQDI